jgi:hypothetical protein
MKTETIVQNLAQKLSCDVQRAAYLALLAASALPASALLALAKDALALETVASCDGQPKVDCSGQIETPCANAD